MGMVIFNIGIVIPLMGMIIPDLGIIIPFIHGFRNEGGDPQYNPGPVLSNDLRIS